MKLSELTLPISYADSCGIALVFTSQLAARLAELHGLYGTKNCVPVPRVMSDGRLMLCGDILTEVMPGGLLAAMWDAADKKVLGESVGVMPWAEAVAMLPPDRQPA
jgi:hypothetical protein